MSDDNIGNDGTYSIKKKKEKEIMVHTPLSTTTLLDQRKDYSLA